MEPLAATVAREVIQRQHAGAAHLLAQLPMTGASVGILHGALIRGTLRG